MRTKSDGTPQTSLDFIRDIIVREMQLDQDRVNIFNQMWKIPTMEGLFILVDYKGSPKVISNRSSQEWVNGDFVEVFRVNTQELVSINIMSRNQ